MQQSIGLLGGVELELDLREDREGELDCMRSVGTSLGYYCLYIHIHIR